MIKEIIYRNKIVKNYFINSETAEITDINGVIQKTHYVEDNTRICWKGMLVYRIMMHTFNGYLKRMDIHHKDFNSLNDSLNNLQYLTPSGHHKIHNESGHPLKGKHHSEETKRKMSNAHIGNKCALGHKHTEEAKRKISSSMKGHISPNKGKPCTEEIKQKIRDANTGKTFTDEHKQKIRNALIGKRKGTHWYHKDGEKPVLAFEPPSSDWALGRQ